MKYKVVCLIFAFSLINFNIGYAFFLLNDHSEKLQIDHTTIDKSTQDNNVFHLYDNFFYNNPDGLIIKKVDGFLSADKIEINIPLKILARDSIYPENLIDRMLLANLRLKELAMEYAQLQKKARFLLQNNTMSGLSKTEHRKPDDKGINDTDSIEDEKNKINRKLFDITRLSVLTQGDVLPEETILFENHSMLKNKMNPSIFLAEREDISNQLKTDFNTNSQIITRKGNKELPWVFKAFLKILNYILTNRIEIIIYMIFIVTIGYFISLRVRQ